LQQGELVVLDLHPRPADEQLRVPALVRADGDERGRRVGQHADA